MLTTPVGPVLDGGPCTPRPGPVAGAERRLDAVLGFRMGRTHQVLRAAWAEVISDLGLSPPQSVVLRAVAERPGYGLRELSRQLGADAMNAKRLADHLESLGLLRSSSAPGHRQRRALTPTPQGQALAAELARRATAWDRHLAEIVGPSDFAQLQYLLGRLQAALAEHHGLGEDR